jgi:hypothetical protein
MAESSSVQNQNQSRRGASPSRGRRRPQGRGGKRSVKPKNAGSLSTGSAPNAPAASTPNGEEPEPELISKDTDNPQAQADVQPEDENAGQDESDLCWICAEPIKYYAVSDCNHRTCHVCALRLRALYKKLECTFCKVRAAFPL